MESEIPIKMRWRLQAACRNENPDLFFPTTGDTEGMRQAKAVCEGCPVTYECLKAAINGNHSGVWGGTSERERKRWGRKLLLSKGLVESVR